MPLLIYGFSYLKDVVDVLPEKEKSLTITKGLVNNNSPVASDGRGGETEGSVFVKVPHDQSGDCVSIDEGQYYDATAIN